MTIDISNGSIYANEAWLSLRLGVKPEVVSLWPLTRPNGALVQVDFSTSTTLIASKCPGPMLNVVSP